MVGTPPYRQPDISLVVKERLPANLRVKADFAPDLAVEIVSESDVVYEIEAKIAQYLQSGVKLVWIIYPVSGGWWKCTNLKPASFQKSKAAMMR